MRTLRFIVNGQIIAQDPNCDFSNLVSGTDGYLKAAFRFSSEWRSCNKVAAFYSVMGAEYPPQVLNEHNECIIPAEALKRRGFKIRVFGKAPGLTITTDKVLVQQTGGKT